MDFSHQFLHLFIKWNSILYVAVYGYHNIKVFFFLAQRLNLTTVVKKTKDGVEVVDKSAEQDTNQHL